MKATYRRNGLVYRESSSEDEGVEGSVLSSEVIEIDDDDDDDVIAVGCCKSCYFVMRTLTFHCCSSMKTIRLLKICFCSAPHDASVVPPKKPAALSKDPVVRTINSVAGRLIESLDEFNYSCSVSLIVFLDFKATIKQYCTLKCVFELSLIKHVTAVLILIFLKYFIKFCGRWFNRQATFSTLQGQWIYLHHEINIYLYTICLKDVFKSKPTSSC